MACRHVAWRHVQGRAHLRACSCASPSPPPRRSPSSPACPVFFFSLFSSSFVLYELKYLQCVCSRGPQAIADAQSLPHTAPAASRWQLSHTALGSCASPHLAEISLTWLRCHRNWLSRFAAPTWRRGEHVVVASVAARPPPRRHLELAPRAASAAQTRVRRVRHRHA